MQLIAVWNYTFKNIVAVLLVFNIKKKRLKCIIKLNVKLKMYNEHIFMIS